MGIIVRMIGFLLLVISLPFFYIGYGLGIKPIWEDVQKGAQLVNAGVDPETASQMTAVSGLTFGMGITFILIALVTAGFGGLLIMKTSNDNDNKDSIHSNMKQQTMDMSKLSPPMSQEEKQRQQEAKDLQRAMNWRKNSFKG